VAKCCFCGKPYKRLRIDQNCCSKACSKKLDNLELKRAKAVYRALYGWRRMKTPKDRGRALTWIAREVKSWIDEDAGMGRPPAPAHPFDLDRGHERRPSRLALDTSLEKTQ